MKPGTRILFSTSQDGSNIHEHGTLIDTILRNGNTMYLLQYLHRNEKFGDQTRLILITPEEIELIEA